MHVSHHAETEGSVHAGADLRERASAVAMQAAFNIILPNGYSSPGAYSRKPC